MSRNPSPPKCFGWVIESQETHAGFLLPLLLPHQNCRISDVMLSHKPRGSLKQDIENTGMACATDLMRISFPAYDKSFSNQPFTLPHTLSRRYQNIPFLLLPTSVGILRYLSDRDSL